MSAQLQEAIDFYQAGNHAMAMSKLGPIARAMKVVDPRVALMMAQSCYKLGQTTQAALWYDKAAGTKIPERQQVRLLAVNLYMRVKNWQRAFEISRDMVKAEPQDMQALALYRSCLRSLLLFDEMEASDRKVRDWMLAQKPGIFAMEKPLDHLFWSADEALAMQLTRFDNGEPFTTFSRASRRSRPHHFGSTIKIAYLSSDLSDRHATMRLLQGVLLAHDRSRFQVHVLCHTEENLAAADEGMRSRLPGLRSIHGLGDEAVADMIENAGIDILVDLKGHTRDPRLGIVNQGPAPIQVSWLGFPGITTGIDCDYVIGDPVVTPQTSQPFWDPAFCRLPETYQPNDDRYRVLPPPASRTEAGLPADKVVMASFNSHLKITPNTFRLWMRVMKEAPDTVLWMLCDVEEARENMRRAAKKAGVDPKRILFAAFADYPSHIARLQAADMALDTFPCNGHTTTSDKLWAGLPLATLQGTSFASRVSESLLKALGMPELVAATEEDYVALSVRLATDQAYRATIREKIVANRFSAPLFDTERFTRHLENAYSMMVERARQGLAPAPIDVPALPPRTAPFRT